MSGRSGSDVAEAVLTAVEPIFRAHCTRKRSASGRSGLWWARRFCAWMCTDSVRICRENRRPLVLCVDVHGFRADPDAETSGHVLPRDPSRPGDRPGRTRPRTRAPRRSGQHGYTSGNERRGRSHADRVAARRQPLVATDEVEPVRGLAHPTLRPAMGTRAATSDEVDRTRSGGRTAPATGGDRRAGRGAPATERPSDRATERRASDRQPGRRPDLSGPGRTRGG